MNSQLAQWLQAPFRRRVCVIAFLAVVTGFLEFLITTDWQSIYFAGDGSLRMPGPTIIGLFIGALIAFIVVEQLLFMAIRPVLSFDDEPYDERQAGLVAEANGQARFSGMIFLVALTIVGTAQVPPATLFFLGCFFIVLTFMTPHLVLAWTLQSTTTAAEEDNE